MVVLAISLHAIFEGIAMGTLGKASVVWYLCFAIAAHKFIIAFCVGMQVCVWRNIVATKVQLLL